MYLAIRVAHVDAGPALLAGHCRCQIVALTEGFPTSLTYGLLNALNAPEGVTFSDGVR